jgi:hypothetical protein
MKNQTYIFALLFYAFLVSTISVSAQNKPETPACIGQNPEAALFSNIDLPANGRPTLGKQFNFTGTAKTLADTNTVSSALVWKPDLCTPLLIGIEQKAIFNPNSTTSQQTLIGISWKNISVTAVQQDGKIGVISSTSFSF